MINHVGLIDEEVLYFEDDKRYLSDELHNPEVFYVGYGVTKPELKANLDEMKKCKVIYFLYAGHSELLESWLRKRLGENIKFVHDHKYCVPAVLDYQKYWINKLNILDFTPADKMKVVSWGNGNIAKGFKIWGNMSYTMIDPASEVAQLPDAIHVLIINNWNPVDETILDKLYTGSIVINTARESALENYQIEELAERGVKVVTDVNNITNQCNVIATNHSAWYSRNSLKALVHNAMEYKVNE